MNENKDDTEDDGNGTDAAPLVTKPLIDPELNECHVLWQGELPKRSFVGFKFQVCHVSVSR